VIAEEIAFELPSRLEARRPPEARGVARDGVRLLVSDARSGVVEHRTFSDFPKLLRPFDLLVVNDSATLPAALEARRSDGTAIPLHVSTRMTNTLWVVEPRGARRGGDVLALPSGGSATLLERVARESDRLWYARVDVCEPYVEYLHRYGQAIRYAYVDGCYPIADYQTIFARVPGSAEMPSAGRPFTARTLADLREREVKVATVTLHAGVSSAEAHEPPQAEPFVVPHATALAVNATHRDGGRVIAVGTTVVRALESAAMQGDVVASSGWTELVVTPERGLRVTDGILTGFHEPRASHLAMLRAFASAEVLDAAYRAALSGEYLWHEFGDVHLIA
jgi:S-adenosylmethionine:tRNA ribosyltransferase-isomerase